MAPTAMKKKLILASNDKARIDARDVAMFDSSLCADARLVY
jgi:hypothetical protein